MGQNGLHHRPHLRGGLVDLGLHPDDLLFRLVALDVAFQSNALAHGLDGFGVGLVLDGSVNNRFQVLDRRLGESFLDGGVHFLPMFLARRLRDGCKRQKGERGQQQDRQSAFHRSHPIGNFECGPR